MGDKPLIATPELGYNERKRLYKKGLLIAKKVKKNFQIRQKKEKLKKLFHRLRVRFLTVGSARNIEEQMASRIFTHLTKREKKFLKCLAGKVPAGGIIVEIGSYLGASTCFLAMGARREGQKIYCVDTWHNEAMSEGPRDTFAEFQSNIAPFKDKIFFLRGKSAELAQNFRKKIDLLFIDADHSFSGCSSDIKAWFPYLNRKAIVILHDYNWAEGVQRAVRELVKPAERRPGQKFENMYWTRI